MDTKQILDYYINIGKNNTKKYKIVLFFSGHAP